MLIPGAGAIDAVAQGPAAVYTSRDGKPHRLADLHGHPAVVNFWATWCGPCREEMPRLQKLADTYGARGVQFVAIALDAPETQSKIDAIVVKRGFHIPVWTGATDQTLTEWKLGGLVPATLVLDETGEVIGRIEGEANERDIRSRLDWLAAGRPGKVPNPVVKHDW